MLEELKIIHNEISNCNKCKGLKSYNKFNYYGNLSSKKMLIGEAPGKGSIKNKRPWSGPSSEVLRNPLEQLGKSLYDEFYLTDLVRCLPPDKNPTGEQRRNCKNYLFREIEELQPNVILTVGDYATRCVLEKYAKDEFKPITELHGGRIKIKGKGREFTIIPIVSPSHGDQHTKRIRDRIGADYRESVRNILQELVDR